MLSNPIIWAVIGGVAFLAIRFAMTFWLPEKHWINETLAGPDIKPRDRTGSGSGGGDPGGFGDCGGGDGGGGGD